MTLAGGKPVRFDVPEGHTVTVVVLSGTVEINGAQIVRRSGVTIPGQAGDALTIEAAGDTKLLILAGAAVREAVVAHGPFVMNTMGEIKKAMMDYQEGRFQLNRLSHPTLRSKVSYLWLYEQPCCATIEEPRVVSSGAAPGAVRLSG